MLFLHGTKNESHKPDTLGALAVRVAAAGGAYVDVRPRGTQEPVEPDGSLFELYEIRQEHGRTVLLRVSTEAMRR
jgi:hypothetical protein